MEFKLEIEIESSKLTLDKYFNIVTKLREYTKEKITYMDGNDYIFTNFRVWYYEHPEIKPCISLYCNENNKNVLIDLIKNNIY